MKENNRVILGGIDDLLVNNWLMIGSPSDQLADEWNIRDYTLLARITLFFVILDDLLPIN